MWRTCLTIQIILCLILPGKCRKYDLQADAIKLYGEDFKNLLKRFRRSPEYMNILDDKLAELKEEFDDMFKQIVFGFLGKLENKVNETLYEQKKSKDETKLRVMRRMNNETTSTLSPVEKLDNHEALQSPITVAEKNYYKDLGFKFAGEAIHALIEQAKTALYDETEASRKSTRMVDSRYNFITTTEHVKVHEVTSEGPTVGPTEPPVQLFKYRARNETKEKYAIKLNEPSVIKENVSAENAKRYGEYGRRMEDIGDRVERLVMEPYDQTYYNAVAQAARRNEVYGEKKFKPGVY